jgi:hypothetical protein
MKALVFREKNTLENFRIKLEEVPEPTLNEYDVLVSVARPLLSIRVMPIFAGPKILKKAGIEY